MQKNQSHFSVFDGLESWNQDLLVLNDTKNIVST